MPTKRFNADGESIDEDEVQQVDSGDEGDDSGNDSSSEWYGSEW